MKPLSPPHWMERMLLSVVPARNRENVAGDLQEEFSQSKRPQMGELRANLWYARQVLSFLPAHLWRVFEELPALFLLCGFTASSGLWLGAMGLRLRHPGYTEGELIAGTIVLQALLTIAASCFRESRVLRWTALAGTGAILWLAVKALRATLSGAHLEGYILLISFGLIAQAYFTLRNLANPRNGRRSAGA